MSKRSVIICNVNNCKNTATYFYNNNGKWCNKHHDNISYIMNTYIKLGLYKQITKEQFIKIQKAYILK